MFQEQPFFPWDLTINYSRKNKEINESDLSMIDKRVLSDAILDHLAGKLFPLSSGIIISAASSSFVFRFLPGEIPFPAILKNESPLIRWIRTRRSSSHA